MSSHFAGSQVASDAQPTEAAQKLAKLTDSPEGEIKNPLKGIPRETLLKNVGEWRSRNGLPEDILPLLEKGALVAQNPAGFESLDLEPEEKQALREEVTNRWKHPWPLYYTIFLNSIAAAIQGWDQVS